MSELTEKVIRAYFIAEEAHRGQTRRDGFEPFINHPVRVSYWAVKNISTFANFKYVDVQAVALLHDVIEDTHHTVESLKAEGMGGWADVVDVLSRKPDETYFDYIRGIKKYAEKQDGTHWKENAAVLVKIADIWDNVSDVPGSSRSEYIPNPEAISMIKRYSKALVILDAPRLETPSGPVFK
jgi:guanosine-3',5'-bis(diphosphate) 3'-pyrophosphohydrolase